MMSSWRLTPWVSVFVSLKEFTALLFVLHHFCFLFPSRGGDAGQLTMGGSHTPKEQKFLDMTSLTLEEFDQRVPAFEEAFEQRLKEWCLDGKQRSGREYRTYANCRLPPPEDRLLFILVYVKTNVLQVVQGELFAMPQNKANQWIHPLLPV